MAGRPDSLVVRDQIDKQEVPRVWLWAGPEAFLKEDLQERAAKTLLEEGLAELNLSRFRGTEDSADVIVSTAQTLPMMATRRLVIVRAVEGLDRKGRERLLAYVENAVPETLLILMGEKGPRDPFFAKLGKAGAKVATFWHPSDAQLATWVRLRFKDLGLELEPNLCEQILESCNTGGQITLSALAPELEKIALSAKGNASGKVSEDDLSVISKKANEALLYEITRKVGERDTAGALRALDGAMLFKENSAVRIVATLAIQFGKLTHIKDLQNSGMPSGMIQKEIGLWPKLWPEHERAARRFEASEIHQSLKILKATDQSLKSLPLDPKLTLERSIISICHRP